MTYEEFRDRVFAAAAAKGLTEYELFYRGSESLSLSVFDGAINNFKSSGNKDCAFRCGIDGHIGSASSNAFTEAAAISVVERAMENGRCMEKDEKPDFVPGGLSYAPAEPAKSDSLTTAEMVSYLLKAYDVLRAADPLVTAQSSAELVAETYQTALDNANGVHLASTGHIEALIPIVVVSKDGEVQDAFDFKVGSLAEMDEKEVIGKAIGKAKDKLGADVPESGTYPVVLGAGAMRELLGVFLQAFSAENSQNGLSLLTGKEETAIASEAVTILDDPFCEKAVFKKTFDGEGTPTYRKAVVENGVFKTMLHSRATAAKAGVASTGNGSRGAVDSPVTVAPTNLFFAPGEKTKEELYAMAGNGVLVTAVSGLHAGANYVTGDFSLQSNGFLLENGKKTKAIRSFTIAGNYYEMLKTIKAVADDLDFGFGNVGSPSVLVGALTVAGK